jgi:hypothetical protein
MFMMRVMTRLFAVPTDFVIESYMIYNLCGICPRQIRKEERARNQLHCIVDDPSKLGKPPGPRKGSFTPMARRTSQAAQIHHQHLTGELGFGG